MIESYLLVFQLRLCVSHW